LGTSCFDVYQLLNICIPTLTKEVVKKSQHKSVNKIVQTAKNFVASLLGPDTGTFVPAFAQA